MKNLPVKPWIIAVGALLVVLLFVGGCGYKSVSDARKQAVDLETQISAQYQANQAQRSAYANGLIEQLDLADKKTDRLRSILQDAISGRYGNGGLGKGSPMFLALAESYPDLTQNMNIYDTIAAYVQDKRTAFANDQVKLRDLVRRYDNLREGGGFINPIRFDIAGVPTNNLCAQIGSQSVCGEQALPQIKTLLTDQGTRDAFETGDDKPLLGSDSR